MTNGRGTGEVVLIRYWGRSSIHDVPEAQSTAVSVLDLARMEHWRWIRQVDDIDLLKPSISTGHRWLDR